MDVFVTRQPIFDKTQKVMGYELLFRKPFQSSYTHEDHDDATLAVMSDGFFSIGLERMTGGKPAFINFTRKLLLEEVPQDIRKELMVVEILENIEPDAEILEACQKLKKEGYTLVLDDFVFHKKYLPLMDLADMIKVDFLQSTPLECEYLVKKYARPGLHFCAEKVESREQFESAKSMGYDYFQGFFFCKPEIITGKRISGYKLTYLQVLDEIQKPDLDFNRIEDILKRDVSLSYKLLRLINSSFYGLRNKVKSIKHALVLLGVREIRRWITVMAIHGMGDDKPEELLVNSITRAKFCELTAELTELRDRQQDLFLMGLFSRIDAFLDRPIEEILTQLPLYDDVKAALAGEENAFREVYDIMQSYELGEWEQFIGFCDKKGFNKSAIITIYLKSIEWSNQVFEQNPSLRSHSREREISPSVP